VLISHGRVFSHRFTLKKKQKEKAHPTRSLASSTTSRVMLWVTLGFPSRSPPILSQRLLVYAYHVLNFRDANAVTRMKLLRRICLVAEEGPEFKEFVCVCAYERVCARVCECMCVHVCMYVCVLV
jgi:hypothetical protein